MLTGYNTDFKFQGKIYHVQTEDGGTQSPNITSLLYQQGAILASRKTSYADILKADCLEEVVRELMMEQHKQMIRDLMQGKLDLNNAPHEAAYQPSSVQKPVPEKKPEPTKPAKPAAAAPPPPGPKAEVKEKSLDDIILEFLAQEQQERNQKKQ
ncbi:MAG TPA: hypothetical protein VK654_07815 [Nitrospirota bacterium]|nr:hypothetical protein [Nitrospirota bacterium]